MTTEDSMTDNVLQTLQQLVQDVIAPDVRELKVRQAVFEKLVDERFNSQSKQSEMQFSDSPLCDIRVKRSGRSRSRA